VINGGDAFVGSDRAHARRSIESALAAGNAAPIDLQARLAHGEVSVDFALTSRPEAGAVLRLALVQIEAQTEVTAGENAGRTLRHANVVRGFQTVQLHDTLRGHTTFARAADEVAIGVAIVAFVQDSRSMAIRGAAQANVF